MNVFGSSGVRAFLGYVGLALLVIVLVNLLVRRLGGWRKLGRWIKRETRRTVNAFVEPIAARRRYKRRLRLLGQVLRDQQAWVAAEQVIVAAANLLPGYAPYAVALTRKRVGVLVAGPDAHAPLPAPWQHDDQDPRLWWIDRDSVPEPAARRAETPLLVCLGTDSGGTAVLMIDLLSGPRSLSVYGVDRIARPVVQAIAAQLDVRLPVGAIEVAEGIHSQHDGLPLAQAVVRLGAWFIVGAEPLHVPLPSGRRLLSLGPARGSSRLVEALPDQSLRLHGAAEWLRIDPLPLARAVQRSIRSLPPHDFGTDTSFTTAEPLDDLDDLRMPAGTIGVSASAADAGEPTRKAASWS
ncbi:hypothetical protein HPO96_18080 [Kribbella sandramycini]|uniref:Uncharacterized protein n=1 Tax=Kribbella sandramycini TaxID=60450 RepID=A0A7Y4L0Q0_9ACTN|nr:hypothetical protein [Kribbella sandramycini]MBB6565895.1 hypothetical protein [Kribbella sandramycini]NOL42157.1 hypothetical protein [Kribbella sandramycini]